MAAAARPARGDSYLPLYVGAGVERRDAAAEVSDLLSEGRANSRASRTNPKVGSYHLTNRIWAGGNLVRSGVRSDATARVAEEKA